MPTDPEARAGGEERREKACRIGNARNVGIPCKRTNHLKSVLVAKRSANL
jgi:hypothetical protein